MPMRTDRPCRTFLKLWNPIHATNPDCWTDWGHSMPTCCLCCLIFVSPIVGPLPVAPLLLWRASSKIPRGYLRSCTWHRCYRPMRQPMMISSWFLLKFDYIRWIVCKLSRIDDDCQNLCWIYSSQEAMRGPGIVDVSYSVIANDEKFTTMKSRVESVVTLKKK